MNNTHLIINIESAKSISFGFSAEARVRRQSWNGEHENRSNGSSFTNNGRKDITRLGNQFTESDSAKRRGSNSSVDSR